jgi:hypothetical protein
MKLFRYWLSNFSLTLAYRKFSDSTQSISHRYLGQSGRSLKTQMFGILKGIHQSPQAYYHIVMFTK